MLEISGKPYDDHDNKIIRRALAGESMLEIARENNMHFEDVYALLCRHLDETRDQKSGAAKPIDCWRLSLK